MIVTVGSPPSAQVVRRAVEALRRDEVVALPTDTVYGIAALPDRHGATERLFALKGRTAAFPLAVLCADVEQALSLADPVTPDVRRIAERLWPGPLTLVLPRRAGLGYHLGEPARTIGVRCPDHDLVRELARVVGPIAATSANRHGQPTPTTAAGVAEVFGDEVALVLDGGPRPAAASTVVDASGPSWQILRPGPVGADDLMAAAR